MIQKTINPVGSIYSAEDYAHALEVTDARRWLYVSGTMGLDLEGRAPPDLDRQLELIWRNIGAVLAEAGMTVDHVVRVTSYLTRAEYAAANQEARLRALGGRRVPTTAIVAGTLDPTWWVEVEVIAAAG